MRYAFAASALCGLVVAAPRPQEINIAAIETLALPTVLGAPAVAVSQPPISYNPTSAASAAAAAVPTDPVKAEKRSVSKRTNDDCAPADGGLGPRPGGGSVAEYLDPNNELAQLAEAAGVPTGYAKSFTNEQGATQQIGYLTFKTLSKYSPDECAAFCDSEKFCYGFNIYFERDPSLNPAAACPNPAAFTNIKCALYGYPVSSTSATNKGQWRNEFQVVIAGSNGYSKLLGGNAPNKAIPGVADFTSIQVNGVDAPLPAAIRATSGKNGKNPYMGMRLFNDGPFDPSICAATCKASTQFDKEHIYDATTGYYDACNFFNAYILMKNDVPQGTYCSFYTQAYEYKYSDADNTGYYSGSDAYKVVFSLGYQLAQYDEGIRRDLIN